MLELLTDFACGIAFSSGGAGAGWLLHRALRGTAVEVPEEQKMAKEVLHRLKDLAAHMAAGVGQHSSHVEEINQELTEREPQGPEGVISAVARLIESNQSMQSATRGGGRQAPRAGPAGREQDRRGPHRRAHRAGQSPRVRRQGGRLLRGIRAKPPVVLADPGRHRPLQKVQRHTRPPDGRRGAPRHRSGAPRHGPREPTSSPATAARRWRSCCPARKPRTRSAPWSALGKPWRRPASEEKRKVPTNLTVGARRNGPKGAAPMGTVPVLPQRDHEFRRGRDCAR